jgi:integrase
MANSATEMIFTPRWYTVAQVAQLLNYGESKVRMLIILARHTCATLLVDLDVRPRVIMRILRHADQAVTMEIYANASSTARGEALRRLGESLH